MLIKSIEILCAHEKQTCTPVFVLLSLGIIFSSDVCGADADRAAPPVPAEESISNAPVKLPLRAVELSMVESSTIEQKKIIDKINLLKEEAILFLTNPLSPYLMSSLPPYLKSHFRQVTQADMVRVAPIPPAALLHMNTCGTLWVNSSKSAEEIDQAIIKYTKSYATLAQALAIPAGTLVPKHIIATEAEVRNATQTAATNVFFKANPEAVLVLDMGTATLVLDMGTATTVNRFNATLPANVRHLAIVGQNLTTIGALAFQHCRGLTNVTIPVGVITIEVFAFDGCLDLRKVAIPTSVKTIEYAAFADCTGLTRFTIPKGVTTIGIMAFHSCTGLTSITIPNSVTTIGSSAFTNCTGLTRFTIPKGVTTIGIMAFADCTGLTSVTIPTSVKTIGELAFSSCTGIREIYVEKGSYADIHMRQQYPHLAKYIRYMG